MGDGARHVATKNGALFNCDAARHAATKNGAL